MSGCHFASSLAHSESLAPSVVAIGIQALTVELAVRTSSTTPLPPVPQSARQLSSTVAVTCPTTPNHITHDWQRGG
ncbi:hypothetical protein ACFX11_014692 [Malus domestica]